LERHPLPKRYKIFEPRGFQLRYTALVFGSLSLLLIFASLHWLSWARATLSPQDFDLVWPALKASTARLFLVGGLYIAVVSVAAVFLSHRLVGPASRLEKDLRTISTEPEKANKLHVRSSDELEGVVDAINDLISKLQKEHIEKKERTYEQSKI
jgi:methyl-accepting chemotaxis protein